MVGPQLYGEGVCGYFGEQFCDFLVLEVAVVEEGLAGLGDGGVVAEQEGRVRGRAQSEDVDHDHCLGGQRDPAALPLAQVEQLHSLLQQRTLRKAYLVLLSLTSYHVTNMKKRLVSSH